VTGSGGTVNGGAARVSVTLKCASAEATRAVAAGLARHATPGTVVALCGELGTGKTCFVQGLAAGLGVEGPVTSPTFVLIAEHAGRLPLYHVDLYRTESLAEIRALGLEEMLDGVGLTAIEWAEKAEPLLPSRTVRVLMRGAGDEPRTLEIDGVPPDWVAPV
jgi:tRNA threonylcarbamoyladenosine biosynthesis protein TsaE